MQMAALRHAKMAKQLTTLRAVVSFAVEFMLERSPTEAF
jgi:hypothetical protein